MSTSTPTPSPAPTGDDPSVAPAGAAPTTPVGASFEEKLTLFWSNNRKPIIALCVLVLVVITGKGAWQVFQAQREKGIGAEYAKAANSDQLKKFAADHGNHALAGVAYLRLADEAYSANKPGDAAPLYSKASAILKTGPLAGRAAMGGAVAKLLAGDRAGGEMALKALSADLGQPPAIRAEATYHLSTLAAEAGDAAALQKYLEQITAISPQSLWADRASLLKARQLASAASSPSPAPAAAPDTSAEGPRISFPSKAK